MTCKQALIARGGATLALVFLAATCEAGLFSSTTTGDWTNVGGWNLTSGVDAGGNGYPDTGDGASIAHAKTLANSVAFGSSAVGEGSTWSNVSLTLNNNSTLTHVAGSTLAIDNGDRSLAGNGTLINQGVINHNTELRIDMTGSSLRNEGTYNFLHTGGSRQVTVRTGTVFTNTGTVEVLGTGEARFEFGSGSSRVFNDGGTLAATNGDIEFDGTIEFEASAGSQFNAANGRMIDISSAVRSQIRGTASVVGSGRVQVNGITFVNDAVFDVDGDGLGWSGGINPSGFHVRNDGIMYNDTTGDRTVGSSGTFEIGSTGSLTWNSTSRVDLQNQNIHMLINGLFEDVTNSAGAAVNLFTVRGALLEVGETGHLLKSAGTGGRRIEGPITGGVNPRFTNSGVVEVQSGALLFDDSRVQMLDFSGSTLLRGTWHANNGNITIHSGVQDVATIGADATVILTGSGVINRIGTTLATVEGGFFVNNKTFTTGAGGLTADKSNGGPAVVGGNGTIVGNLSGPFTYAPGTSAGTLTVNGTAQWAGGTTAADAGGYDFEIFSLADTSPAVAGTPATWDLLQATNIDFDNTQGGDYFVNVTLADGSTVTAAEMLSDFSLLIAESDSAIADFGTLNFQVIADELLDLIDPELGSGAFSVLRGDALGQGNNQIYLAYDFSSAQVVPEPGSLALWLALLGGGVAVVAKRRRVAV